MERNTKHAGLFTAIEVKSLMTQSGVKPSVFLFSVHAHPLPVCYIFCNYAMYIKESQTKAIVQRLAS